MEHKLFYWYAKLRNKYCMLNSDGHVGNMYCHPEKTMQYFIKYRRKLQTWTKLSCLHLINPGYLPWYYQIPCFKLSRLINNTKNFNYVLCTQKSVIVKQCCLLPCYNRHSGRSGCIIQNILFFYIFNVFI